MAHTLPPLPYPNNALEPSIDALTMEIHHDRHHKAYVDNLNKALEGHTDLQNKSTIDLLRNINSVPQNIRQAVINNGGGDANHTMFWQIMGPKASGKPSGPLADDINQTFKDFATFQQQLKQAAVGRFGSGWAWLVLADGKLQIVSTANQDSPHMNGQTPILGVDVWEHAYYLKYQNKRPDYVDAWWNVVNWNAVAQRYSEAKAGRIV
jgi:Fe-Mn family superoxide dismutase